MNLNEKLARWADKQGWFRLSEGQYLLTDGSVVSVSQAAQYIAVEKNGSLIRITLTED